MNEAREKRPPGMTLYREDIAALEVLSGDDFKAAVIALSKVSQGEQYDELSVYAEMAVKMIGSKIEEAARRYTEKCEKNRQSIQARWNNRGIRSYTTEYDNERLSTNHTNYNDNYNYNGTKTKTELKLCGVGDESSKRPKRFSPPTVLQVQEYCTEKGYPVDAERFVDFYASKGWRVGNTPMKDWQAAVRTWAKKEGGKANGNDNGGLGTGSAKHSAIVLPFECEY